MPSLHLAELLDRMHEQLDVRLERFPLHQDTNEHLGATTMSRTHLLLVRQPHVCGNSRLVVCLRLYLLHLGQVHLRQRKLLLALVDLGVDINLALFT